MIDIIRDYERIMNDVLLNKADVPENYRYVNKIMIVGIGGSAISGDVLKDWLKDSLKIPIEVVRGFDIPAYVDSNTLFICISYSGNTREPLQQLEQAMKKNCKIFGIFSGGIMENIFKEKNLPYTKVPMGMVPRMAFPYIFFSLVNVMRALGFVRIDEIRIDSKNAEDVGKDISIKIKDTIPIIVGSYESVCRRWKNNLNENAKTIAIPSVLPELVHNDFVAWKNLDEKFSLIILESEREENKKAIEFIKKKFGKCRIIEVEARGRSKIERMLYFILLAGFTSYYLAKLKNELPEENEIINEWKRYLSE